MINILVFGRRKNEINFETYFSLMSNDGVFIGKGSRTLAVYYDSDLLHEAHTQSKALIDKIIKENPNTFQYRNDLYSTYVNNCVEKPTPKEDEWSQCQLVCP